MFEKFSFQLNQLMDACHLTYIKNWKKKPLSDKSFHILNIFIRTTPTYDAWMGIDTISIEPPKKSMVKVYAGIIVLKEE